MMNDDEEHEEDEEEEEEEEDEEEEEAEGPRDLPFPLSFAELIALAVLPVTKAGFISCRLGIELESLGLSSAKITETSSIALVLAFLSSIAAASRFEDRETTILNKASTMMILS